MAHLLGAEAISHSFPTKTVFKGVTVGINEGDRIGVVGRNGDGKSTLLKILTKQLQPDAGRVTWRGGLQVGFLRQQDNVSPELTIAEVVVGDRPEHEWASDPKIRDVLAGLISDLDWSLKVSTLSGGQLRRVALAQLLVGEQDVIMLDEPTNPLDIDGVNWLAQHLRDRWSKNSGGLLVITHDRWFLDAISNYTWEVVGGRIEPFVGGYAAYIQQRAERARQQAAIEARRQNLLRKELAWLGRGAPARTTKPKFRMDAALELIGNEPPPRDPIELAKLATTRLGKDVVDLEDVNYSIDGKQVLKDVTLRLGPGDRIGLLGRNGIGKTTLLKILTGELSPTSGRVKIGKTVKFAKLSQDVRELDAFADERIYTMIRREKTTFMVGKKEIPTSQLVEQLGFESAELQTPIGDLSGGQRRRFQLLRLLFTEPNVLILDEPTNDLDTDMLAALEDLLDSWPGTLIVVSHDRYLMERTTDNQYAILPNGTFRHLPGGVDQYLNIKVVPAESKKEKLISTEMSGAERRALEKESARLERQLSKLQQELSEIHLLLAEANQSDYTSLTELSSRETKTRLAIAQTEESWLEVAQKLQS
jgi:ATPase subunit of ABC transporter with duplicated ATPase domains